MSSQYTALASSDDMSATNLADLFALLERFIQISIWDCPAQGYGPDPSNASDAAGITCTNANKGSSWKCRMRFRLAELFKRIFKVAIPFP